MRTQRRPGGLLSVTVPEAEQEQGRHTHPSISRCGPRLWCTAWAVAPIMAGRRAPHAAIKQASPPAGGQTTSQRDTSQRQEARPAPCCRRLVGKVLGAMPSATSATSAAGRAPWRCWRATPVQRRGVGPATPRRALSQ